MKLIIAGGGFAGCAAAYTAAKNGMDVTLLERTDLLLGTGQVGGIFRNNGRFTAAEEIIALGGGEFFSLLDQNARHKNISFPGHEHASLFDITKVPIAIEQLLRKLNVNIHFQSRISSAVLTGSRLLSVCTDEKETFEGDVFIDATGSCGPMKNCTSLGNGCAMCIMRCPTFGPRCSLTSLTGLPEHSGRRKDGTYGSFSGSCKLLKESLSPELVEELNRTGVVIVPVPKELQENHLGEKACQQYAYNAYLENLVLLDTGHAKMMTPFYPLHKLHMIPGFEHARYEDPYSAGVANSIRMTCFADTDASLKLNGLDNLFAAGEKAGLFVGHTEAILTGLLAGYNAARYAYGLMPFTLPRSLCCGELIAFAQEQMKTPEGLFYKYSFSGSVFFEQMKRLGLYSVDPAEIKARVQDLDLTNRFLTLFT